MRDPAAEALVVQAFRCMPDAFLSGRPVITVHEGVAVVDPLDFLFPGLSSEALGNGNC